MPNLLPPTCQALIFSTVCACSDASPSNVGRDDMNLGGAMASPADSSDDNRANSPSPPENVPPANNPPPTDNPAADPLPSDTPPDGSGGADDGSGGAPAEQPEPEEPNAEDPGADEPGADEPNADEPNQENLVWVCDSDETFCYCVLRENEPPGECSASYSCCFHAMIEGGQGCQCFELDEESCEATIATDPGIARVESCPP